MNSSIETLKAKHQTLFKVETKQKTLGTEVTVGANVSDKYEQHESSIQDLNLHIVQLEQSKGNSTLDNIPATDLFNHRQSQETDASVMGK